MSLDAAEQRIDGTTLDREKATVQALVSIARSLDRLADAAEERNLRERYFAEEAGCDADELFAHYATGRPTAEVTLDPGGPLS